ncbi:unnamed protein product [Schistosoma mattheei]|uniref:Uncharacterized protein n=1 Tax=Schistosoma mattheei TaxID=31246 RepID=A0A183PUB0_9TREM|nr:unnamed protein product [Schistosoma mattheei]
MVTNHLGSKAGELIDKAFLKEFLNRPVPLSLLDIKATQTNLLTDYIVPILEISKAIQKTKNVKAAEPNSMSAEALKSDIGVNAKMRHVLFAEIWNGKQVVRDWTDRHLIKILKKLDRDNCENRKRITLLSVPVKSPIDCCSQSVSYNVGPGTYMHRSKLPYLISPAR